MVRPRGRPPATQLGPSDEHLLDAALDAFAERGFAGTSVRELSRSVGVSHNLIPQRFGSKERLWYAAIDHGFGELLERLLDVLNDPAPDDVERLRSMVIRFVEANGARPALLRIINQEAASPGPRLDYLFDRYIQPVRQAGDELLRDLHGRGLLRTSSVSLVYFFMTHGAGGPLSFPALAERFGATVDAGDADAVHRHAVEAIDILFDGLRVSPKGRRSR